MADKTRVRTYAPGYGLFLPKSSAAGPRDCPGCDVGDASPDCAACGKPTAVLVPPIQVGTSAGHALPLCLRCWRVVHEWRAETKTNLRYAKARRIAKKQTA